MKDSFLTRIEILRREITESILTMLANNGLTRLNISEAPNPTCVVWQDSSGICHEGRVAEVIVTEGRFSVRVENGDDIMLYDPDPALENLTRLADIRENVFSVLQELHPRLCHECGKPMTSGFCIGGGAKYFCSEPCLHRNYTPEEWTGMYDDGRSDCYWTEWEEDE